MPPTIVLALYQVSLKSGLILVEVAQRAAAEQEPGGEETQEGRKGRTLGTMGACLRALPASHAVAA